MYRPETAFLVAEWERMNEHYRQFEEFMNNLPKFSCNGQCEKCISVCEKRGKDCDYTVKRFESRC